MSPRSYIEAMDRPTVLYILYTMVSAQQTNLLPKNASRNDTIFAQYHFAILKFLWLRNHHGIYVVWRLCNPVVKDRAKKYVICHNNPKRRYIIISYVTCHYSACSNW